MGNQTLKCSASSLCMCVLFIVVLQTSSKCLTLSELIPVCRLSSGFKLLGKMAIANIRIEICKKRCKFVF
jgi:hypothetical protein